MNDNKDPFVTGYYGKIVLEVENCITAALGNEPENSFYLKAKKLTRPMTSVLAVAISGAKDLIYADKINRNMFGDSLKSLLKELSSDGWIQFGISRPERELALLKMPELKTILKKMGQSTKGLKKDDMVLRILSDWEAASSIANEIVGASVFSLTDNALALIRRERPVEDGALKKCPSPTKAHIPMKTHGQDGEWSMLKREIDGMTTLNSFRLGVWAAEDSERAKKYFSKTLVECFVYSWRELLKYELNSLPREWTYEYFIEHQDIFPLLVKEFLCWGGIFLWIVTGKGKADSIYKICNRREVPDSLAHLWYLDDNTTPRVYSFDEIAFNKRCFVNCGEGFVDEENDSEGEAEITIEIPNIGIQYRDDRGLPSVLINSWGFRDGGRVTYRGPDYSELRSQRAKC